MGVVEYIRQVDCNRRRAEIRSIEQLEWIKGLRAGYKSIGASQKDQYSWLARTEDSFVFTAEIDHIDPARNRFNYEEGSFRKQVLSLSVKNGDHGLRARHAQELLDAINRAHSNGLKCKLMLLKGTKYGTSTGGIHAAVDPSDWIVKELSGDVAGGFEFVLHRVGQQP